jgi:hypothetical protein
MRSPSISIKYFENPVRRDELGPKFRWKVHSIFILLSFIILAAMLGDNNSSDIYNVNYLFDFFLLFSSEKTVVFIRSSAISMGILLRIGRKPFHPCLKFVSIAGCPKINSIIKFKFLSIQFA